MTPEQRALQKIDLLLLEGGLLVQDYDGMDLSAGPGIAVRLAQEIADDLQTALKQFQAIAEKSRA